MKLPYILVIVILGSFIVFHPRISNALILPLRSRYFSKFIESTVMNKEMNAQRYWETREFYYPGVLYVFNDGLESRHIESFTSKAHIRLQQVYTFPILVYDSTKWHSYEALVKTNKLSDVVELPKESPYYEDAETKIYMTDSKVMIFFIKPYDELKVTNGFIYRSEEILKEYQYWFGVSVVTR